MALNPETPNPDTPKTEYTIRAKKVSYQLSRPAYQIGPLKWQWRPTAVAERSAGYILRNVDCEARPGEITAVAGPSGAGKTTLLEILAGVIPTRRVSRGRVLVNNQLMNPDRFRRVSGYVAQDEALFPYLTVEETLVYSSRLRLGGGADEAKARARELLVELGLERVANVRVGSETSRGISGGERRRVSIGVDIVHQPAVLLLDEPTSGLDSASALDVALLLKSMALKLRRTIVLTIHQPGYRILELFDQILLLSNGTVLHCGPLDLLEQRLVFSGHSIPRQVNVLEYAMEVAQSFTVYAAPDVVDEIDLETDNEHFSRTSGDTGEIPYPNSRAKEVLILGKRFSSNICRTKQLFIARSAQSLLAGLVLGTIFMKASSDSNRVKLQPQLGFFAFSLTFLLSSTTEGLPMYLQERRIMTRETTRGAYRVSSYVVSNALVFIPFLLFVALLYAVPVYWLVGLRKDTSGFLYFALVVWVVLVTSNSFVSCFSALVPNYIMGMSLIAGITGSFFLFSGYFISKDDTPRYWAFMHYLSLFKYPFECFVINEFGGGRCAAGSEGQCLLTGEAFLEQQGLDESRKWTNLCVMLGFTAGYRLLCYLILCYRTSR